MLTHFSTFCFEIFFKEKTNLKKLKNSIFLNQIKNRTSLSNHVAMI